MLYSFRFLFFSVPLLLAVLGACGPAPHGPVEATSDSGALSLLLTFDGPLGVGENELDLHVTDAHGSGVPGLTVTVTPHMPAHGHGASMPTTVHEMMDGHYHVMPNFQMTGLWELHFELDDGNTVETAVANVTVE